MPPPFLGIPQVRREANLLAHRQTLAVVMGCFVVNFDGLGGELMVN